MNLRRALFVLFLIPCLAWAADGRFAGLAHHKSPVFDEAAKLPAPLLQNLEKALGEHFTIQGETLKLAILKGAPSRDEARQTAGAAFKAWHADAEMLKKNEALVVVYEGNGRVSVTSTLEFNDRLDPDTVEDLSDAIEDSYERRHSAAAAARTAVITLLKTLNSPLVENERLPVLLPELQSEAGSAGASTGLVTAGVLLGLLALALALYWVRTDEIHVSSTGVHRVPPLVIDLNALKDRVLSAAGRQGPAGPQGSDLEYFAGSWP